jgi:YgiT-type zinc finger domain-containing protein
MDRSHIQERLQMKPDRCSFCKGKLVEGKTEFVAKVGEQIIAIKNVAAYVCENCGEAYYTPEVSRKIDIVMKKFHESKLLLHPVAAGELSFDEIVA